MYTIYVHEFSGASQFVLSIFADDINVLIKRSKYEYVIHSLNIKTQHIYMDDAHSK